MIGLAKEFAEIYQPGRPLPIRLPEKSGALKLLQRIRDEATVSPTVFIACCSRNERRKRARQNPGSIRSRKKAMVRTVIQEFLEAEMAEAIGAQKGERVEGRLSYRSGYYARSLITRVGKLELRVPQDRNGRFSTEIFERYQRREKAVLKSSSSFQLNP
jgi:hypothetical protein